MNNQLELDEWDLAIIYYIKRSQNRTIEDVKNIWRERCYLPEEYTVSAQDLVNHFLPIALKIGEENRNSTYSVLSIVEEASPENVWKCQNMIEGEKDQSEIYFGRIFSVICSRLRLCEVKYLPGFHEYFEKRQAA
jgi:hypothetical protein